MHDSREVRYSFIIPVKEINPYVTEAIPRILEIGRSDYEILVFPDAEDHDVSWERTRQVATGPIGPAEKRDLGLRYAKGEFFVFIDDDAYPRKDLLDVLDRSFLDERIVAVGGPAITPPDDTFWQKVSGAVFLSRFSGGFPERYWACGRKKFVEDWPSVNLTVRREGFSRVGGFDSSYWPGEDTKLCLDLVKDTGGEILYNPEAIVWHHRRSGLIPHLRQVGRYGLHRGYFAKRFPETSMKAYYFMPSAFLLFVCFGWVPLVFEINTYATIYFILWVVYLVALFVAVFEIHSKMHSIKIALATVPYIALTHLWYGYRFLKGLLFTKDLKSRLRG